jgi:hypothetical protein
VLLRRRPLQLLPLLLLLIRATPFLLRLDPLGQLVRALAVTVPERRRSLQRRLLLLLQASWLRCPRLNCFPLRPLRPLGQSLRRQSHRSRLFR